MELELEVIALRHQVAVLNRQRPGRRRFITVDRLFWVLLYRMWPRCKEVMVLVKPATVVQWHRQGFRLFWRWRSSSGRPAVEREIRDLIRQMSSANPLWGAPRIHGELLKLGIVVSQATVAKYMVRRRGAPSPTWRSFLCNHAESIAAIDMFVVASASFRLLYVLIILAHDRRRIVRTAVTEHPTAGWLSRQVTEAFPWDTAPRYLLRDRDASYGSAFRSRVEAMGIKEVITAPRSPWQNAYVERGDCYTAKEAAAELGCSYRHVMRLCEQRRLGHIRRHMRPGIRWRLQVFIPRQALIAYMHSYQRFEHIPALPPDQTNARIPPRSHMRKQDA
jgi:hypothetical protein